ncbi:hypothetical protein LguiA_009124 [Lonicera macranthoides]
MDFDEYEYLEKMVESPEPQKSKETTNGGEASVKPKDKDRSRSSKHRGDENGKGLSHQSKRSKSRDEPRDRDLGRGFSHHHSSSRDGERSERNGKERQRHRDRDSDRDGGINKQRERDRDRRVRNREHKKDREREREGECRSGSHSERHTDELVREKSQDGEKGLEKEYSGREKERDSIEPTRETRRYKDKKEVVELEVDPERDQRTVFAYQISLKADERDVYEFFSSAGKVRDVRLIMDRNSRRSKGVGYIEFYEAMSVPMAIALSGQLLVGLPVMVKPSEAEKNLVQSTISVNGGIGGQIGPYTGGARRLYVGNLHINIKEDQLRQVFEAFGAVELVQLPTDSDTSHSKGYGFVQFARLEDARAAQSLNGQLEIAGRAIKVTAVTDQAGMQDIGVNPGDFDDDEGGGLSLNARSRALLMQKLDRSGTTSSLTVNALAGLTGVSGLSVPAINVPSVDIVGVPSECLLLNNMFDSQIEMEPDFDLDIKDDVQAECSKFGMLKHIYVDKNTAGFVYLRFENTQAAMNAQRALHGRWFAAKMITATFMLPQNYEAKFPDSR